MKTHILSLFYFLHVTKLDVVDTYNMIFVIKNGMKQIWKFGFFYVNQVIFCVVSSNTCRHMLVCVICIY